MAGVKIPERNYSGVYPCTKGSRWQCYVTVNSKRYRVGTYATKLTAHKARELELRKLRSEGKLIYKNKTSIYLSNKILDYFYSNENNSYADIAAKFKMPVSRVGYIIGHRIASKGTIKALTFKELSSCERDKIRIEWKKVQEEKLIEALKQYNSSVDDDLKVNI